MEATLGGDIFFVFYGEGWRSCLFLMKLLISSTLVYDCRAWSKNSDMVYEKERVYVVMVFRYMHGM